MSSININTKHHSILWIFVNPIWLPAWHLTPHFKASKFQKLDEEAINVFTLCGLVLINDLFFGSMGVNFVELGQFAEFKSLSEHWFSLTQWLGAQGQ